MGEHLPEGDLGINRTAIDISAGGVSTFALLDDHTVKCWGNNNEGQLGQGDIMPRGAYGGKMGDDLLPIELW